MAAHLREIVYRLAVKGSGRPPALLLGLVPWPGPLQVETLATNLDGRGNVWRLVQVRGPARELEAARKAFLRHRDPALVERKVVGRGRATLVVWYRYRPDDARRGPSLTKLAFDRLGPQTVATDRTTPLGLEVRLVTAGLQRVRAFLQALEAQAQERHDYRLLYVGPPRFGAPPGLTAAEEEALLAARETGFLGVPRRGSMAGLARRLGCSASAASARLRRAQAKLADAYASG